LRPRGLCFYLHRKAEKSDGFECGISKSFSIEKIFKILPNKGCA